MSTCTTASLELAEPLTATAATARTWLLLEQPGPWGAKALSHSRLDPAVAAALSAALEGTGTRLALIRRPGRHTDPQAPRRVYVAHTEPGRSWVRTTTLADPAELLDLDPAALGEGDHRGLWRPHEGPPLVCVCTNGKRDRCCALLGRPLAAELTASGIDTWEITHIGGHRFSPTLLVLPYGYAYGRTDAPAVKEVTEALRDGRLVTDRCRGRSAWDRPGQAAELAVRELTGEDGVDALRVTDTRGSAQDAEAWAVNVTHTDGRRWRVNVVACADAPPLAASCGAALSRQPRMEAVAVAQLP
ncbi:sucrase ferredoxin [Streptomyces sp. XM4193]|uniref:sucrase ferredoxin n=1 Tax=Streptomyces sp. XM4193 TaxID=2929782 RepID=UPI001FF8D17B|nr:sucrase ferredoxin [Streptomyces sp. XM4193]MCK1798710.1 sucrase ferredoxin [Streptomyces sp. XM4193]